MWPAVHLKKGVESERIHNHKLYTANHGHGCYCLLTLSIMMFSPRCNGEENLNGLSI